MKLHEIFVQYENDKFKTFFRNNLDEQASQIPMKIKTVQMPTKKRMHKSEDADSVSSSSDCSSNGILLSFSVNISQEETFQVFITRTMTLLCVRFGYIIKTRKLKFSNIRLIFLILLVDISLTDVINESEVKLEDITNAKKKITRVTKRLSKQSSNYSSGCIFS